MDVTECLFVGNVSAVTVAAIYYHKYFRGSSR